MPDRNSRINRIVRIPVVILFISLSSSVPMLYDYHTLNTAYAASEGPIATFGDAINLSEDLPPLFVADDVDYDNYAISSPDGENVYAVWGSSNRTIFFRASHDGGATFGPAITLNADSELSGSPRVVSSGNHVFVAFVSNHEGNTVLFFRVSHDNGATFDAAIELGPITEGIDDRQVSVSGSNVYLSWLMVDRMVFRASHDNGNTFDPIVDLGKNLQNPRIAATDDMVYVAWANITGTGGPHNILARASSNNGTTFGPVIDLGIGFFVQDIVATGSNVYILFLRGDSVTQLFFMVSHDSGGSFELPINMGTYFQRGDQDFAQLAVTPVTIAPLLLDSSSPSNYDVYVLWHSINWTDESHSLLLRASHDGGSTFGAANTLASESIFHSDGNIAVAGTNVYVTYRSFVSGIKILFTMSSDSGSMFGPVVEVINTDVYLNVPKLAVISSTNADSEKADNIFVAWQEVNRGGPDGDLFFRPAKFIPLQYGLDLFEGSDPSDLILSLRQEAKAVAATNDPIVTDVNFIWNGPSDSQGSDIVPLVLGSANSTFTPDEVGTWVVIADFGNGEVIQQTLHIDFLVIPESPIGMVALLASSFLALGGFVFWKRKNKPL